MAQHQPVRKRFGCIAAVLFLVTVFFLLAADYNRPYSYQTSSVDDYGQFPGQSEKYMTEYIGRFFPNELSDDFTEVTYCFTRSDIDTYSFEAYLEFTISDSEAFREHVANAVTGLEENIFSFDETFREYVLSSPENPSYLCDCILLGDHYSDEDTGEMLYYIEFADISKILVNYEEQRVIYVALALHDGGGTDTGLLGTFFRRFGISPKDYEAYTVQFMDQYRN